MGIFSLMCPKSTLQFHFIQELLIRVHTLFMISFKLQYPYDFYTTMTCISSFYIKYDIILYQLIIIMISSKLYMTRLCFHNKIQTIRIKYQHA